jgi:hypothetical protein
VKLNMMIENLKYGNKLYDIESLNKLQVLNTVFKLRFSAEV